MYEDSMCFGVNESGLILHTRLHVWHSSKQIFQKSSSIFNTYFKTYWTDTRHVCTYLNPFRLLIPNILMVFNIFDFLKKNIQSPLACNFSIATCCWQITSTGCIRILCTGIMISFCKSRKSVYSSNIYKYLAFIKNLNFKNWTFLIEVMKYLVKTW